MICGIRLQTVTVVFLRMLLKLDTVPQLEMACKNQPLGCIAQLNHNGMYRTDSPLTNDTHSVWLWIGISIALLCPPHLCQTPGGVHISCPYRNAWWAWRPFCSLLLADLRGTLHFYIHWYRGLDMLSTNRWHNLTPGIARDTRLPASISYTSPLFETVRRNAFQWRWPGVLEVILTCLPPPQPSRAEDFRLYMRSVSQTISSFFANYNWGKIILPTKHILHIVACLKSSLWTIYASYEVFSAIVVKGLVVFLYCFHTSIPIGSLVCSSCGDTTALYPLLLPLKQLSAEITT